ncbi:hypothetical protein L486_03699 [Kwoniella mangroviensis CBS 10435]|uniref:Uncharacterized protein n=1 Tax=Kwoniella mangroviensis CBS 10435 TaxID=1331196 RepID=A0A1B9IUK7_9TREE|nr:hypothetical protein L486_03699 [Kwoniella mangroviensis CBS 10435]
MREDSTNRYNGDGSYDTERYEHGLYTSWEKAREAALGLVDEEFEGDKDDYERYEVSDEKENENYELNVRDMEGDEYKIWIEKKEVKGKAPSGPKGKAKGREKPPSKPQAKVKAKKKGNE